MVDQQHRFPFEQVNGEKIGAAGNAIASIVWHEKSLTHLADDATLIRPTATLKL